MTTSKSGARQGRRVVTREELIRLYEESSVHPLHGKDLYTPVSEEMIETLNRLKARYGTWRAVCAAVPCKTRVLRKIRSGRSKAVTMRLWDRVLTATGLEYTLEDYYWFTAEDLVKLGIWKPTPLLEGKGRIVVEGGSDDVGIK